MATMQCPECGREYALSATRCTVDDAELVETLAGDASGDTWSEAAVDAAHDAVVTPDEDDDADDDSDDDPTILHASRSPTS